MDSLSRIIYVFYIQWSMHCVICVNNYPTRCNNIHFIYICKLLYMFRVVSPPIISSSYHWIFSVWHYWDHYCYLWWTWLDWNWFRCTIHSTSTPEPVPIQPRSRQVAVTVSIMPDTVDTGIWAPDDGRRYHPKHVEQFADINKLCVVASCWIIIDADCLCILQEAECEKSAMDIKYNTDTKIEDNSRMFKLQKANFDKEVNTAVSIQDLTTSMCRQSSWSCFK